MSPVEVVLLHLGVAWGTHAHSPIGYMWIPGGESQPPVLFKTPAATVWLLMAPNGPCVTGWVPSPWRYREVVEGLGAGAQWEEVGPWGSVLEGYAGIPSCCPSPLFPGAGRPAASSIPGSCPDV